MEPLWSDEKINSLTVQNANNLDSDARWMHEQIVTDMRNDYERALSVHNETIGQLQGELRNMQALIAGLEEKAEKRETELVRQVDIVIDLQQYIAELEAQPKEREKVIAYAGLELGRVKTLREMDTEAFNRMIKEYDLAQDRILRLQQVYDAARTYVDLQAIPKDGTDDYRDSHLLWLELIDAVRKVQPAA